MNPRRARLWPLLAGILACLAAAGSYLQFVHQLGFPDGHVTDLDAARRVLALVFIGVSVLFALRQFLVALGDPSAWRGRGLAAYLLLAVVAGLLSLGLKMILPGGGGG